MVQGLQGWPRVFYIIGTLLARTLGSQLNPQLVTMPHNQVNAISALTTPNPPLSELLIIGAAYSVSYNPNDLVSLDLVGAVVGNHLKDTPRCPH